MMPFKKTHYNYQDAVLVKFMFKDNNSLKLFIELDSFMNPCKPLNAEVTFNHIKNHSIIQNYFENLKKFDTSKGYYDRINALTFSSKNSFLLEFFHNPKLEILASSMEEI